MREINLMLPPSPTKAEEQDSTDSSYGSLSQTDGDAYDLDRKHFFT